MPKNGEEDKPGLAHRVGLAHRDVYLPEPFEDRRGAPFQIRDRHDYFITIYSLIYRLVINLTSY